jgi:hypothetical protein
MADIQRIGVGNIKNPSMGESELPQEKVPFDFSTNEITFDQMDRTFDENDKPGEE